MSRRAVVGWAVYLPTGLGILAIMFLKPPTDRFQFVALSIAMALSAAAFIRAVESPQGGWLKPLKAGVGALTLIIAWAALPISGVNNGPEPTATTEPPKNVNKYDPLSSVVVSGAFITQGVTVADLPPKVGGFTVLPDTPENNTGTVIKVAGRFEQAAHRELSLKLTWLNATTAEEIPRSKRLARKGDCCGLGGVVSCFTSDYEQPQPDNKWNWMSCWYNDVVPKDLRFFVRVEVVESIEHDPDEPYVPEPGEEASMVVIESKSYTGTGTRKCGCRGF